MGTNPPLTEEERDILQEIMNIAFGKAAADLAEVINIFVVLSVPDIRILDYDQIPAYFSEEMGEYGAVSLIEQSFWGDFAGNAYLVFPAGAGKELISIFDSEGFLDGVGESVEMLERETIMEIGNILIGACVGKIAELLGDVVSYSPPRVLVDNDPNSAVSQSYFSPDDSAIILRTIFCFNDRNVNGFLLLVTKQASVTWLKEALATFMSQYE